MTTRLNARLNIPLETTTKQWYVRQGQELGISAAEVARLALRYVAAGKIEFNFVPTEKTCEIPNEGQATG